MGKTIKTIITCDRCGRVMMTDSGYSWEMLMGKCTALLRENPRWNCKEEFLLCDKCSKAFKAWMEEGGRENVAD